MSEIVTMRRVNAFNDIAAECQSAVESRRSQCFAHLGLVMHHVFGSEEELFITTKGVMRYPLQFEHGLAGNGDIPTDPINDTLSLPSEPIESLCYLTQDGFRTQCQDELQAIFNQALN